MLHPLSSNECMSRIASLVNQLVKRSSQPTTQASQNCPSHQQVQIWDASRNLVLFVQFKECEKHPWRSVTFSLKVKLLHGCFPSFLNCTDGSKSCKASHLLICIAFVQLTTLSCTVKSTLFRSNKLIQSIDPFSTAWKIEEQPFCKKVYFQRVDSTQPQ